MAYFLDRIKDRLNKEGLTAGSKQSGDWLLSKIVELKVSSATLMRDRQRMTESTFIGSMYFYYYDPKTKETLPYYDKFPLVIPIERYTDGFLGLNLHYIHPKTRIILLDKLSQFTNNKKYDKTTRFRLSYDLLSRASKITEFEPCIKRYLYSNIQSRFLEIAADEWDIAALLPVENFQKSSKSKVWSDSRKRI